MKALRPFVVAFAMIWSTVGSALALPVTGLYFTSSEDSWVGQGETHLVTPDDGFEFMSNGFGEGFVSFYINDFASNPDFWSTQWWFLDIAAAQGEALQVGSYENAYRAAFRPDGSPGLDFGGNGRGNNTLTGRFDVLEVTFDDFGQLQSFAADFTQFDEGWPEARVDGRIRYNSSFALVAAPVPEPSTTALMALGLAALFAVRRRA